jgi:hypothetical protein
MSGFLANTGCLLRGTQRFHPERAIVRSAWLLVGVIVVFAPLYGAMMGSFHFVSAEHVCQIAYSAVKLPLLLFATSLVCLPGFFVLNTVLGLREDFGAAVQAILAGQAVLSVVLASLSPVIRFLYFCDVSYQGAILLNGAAFAIATVVAQRVMFRYYRLLIYRRPHHKIMLAAWLVLYTFVGIQMAWALRPFVGSPDAAVTFFRDEPFSNAYVIILRLIF